MQIGESNLLINEIRTTSYINFSISIDFAEQLFCHYDTAWPAVASSKI